LGGETCVTEATCVYCTMVSKCAGILAAQSQRKGIYDTIVLWSAAVIQASVGGTQLQEERMREPSDVSLMGTSINRQLTATPQSGIDRLLLGAVASALEVHLPPRGCGLCDWQLKRVARFIAQHIGDPIKVSQLAAVAKLSPGHFSRAFAVRVGITPRAYLIRQRLRYAQSLMLSSSYQLSDVAFQCGMDHPHFCKLFRRVVGKTPGQWRRDTLLAAAEANGSALH
jgi:AraC family transcriptional regulator